MAKITAVFWDVGGVILTNGWDQESRRNASEEFGLHRNEFEDRHNEVLEDFEKGRLGLDQYLAQTVFYEPRPFSVQAFKNFMFAQSEPHPETLAILKRLASSGKNLLATLNNESLELNLYRINRFGLRDYFTAFFSSCFLGASKPEEAIYRMALEITQRTGGECLLVDDRLPNVEAAHSLGMHCVHYQNPAQLTCQLESFGIEILKPAMEGIW